MSGTRLWYGTGTEWVRLSGPSDGVTPDPEPTVSHDWSETNLPWAYTSTSEFTADWPAGTTIVPLAGTAGQDLRTRINATLATTTGRIVVELPAGVFHITQIAMIGTSGDPLYATGMWFSRLQGLLGQGPDKTTVRLAQNAISQSQIDAMSQIDPDLFQPLTLSVLRLDGATGSPVLVAGITFDAYDQPNITSVHPNLITKSSVLLPQPAPHGGFSLFPGPHGAQVSYCRFQGFARAMNSSPPFEMMNFASYKTSTVVHHVESDGRLSPAIDPARPRRCAVIMLGNEIKHEIRDSWFHHSNLSRYAANDQNAETFGPYTITRCRFDHISEQNNTDPALHNGAPLGGYSNPTPMGWEDVAGVITITDPIVSQDNPKTGTSGAVPMHYQLTSVASRNPAGGRLYIHGGTHLWAHTVLNGYVGFRIQTTTKWWTDGFANTIFVYHANGQRLQPWQHTGSTWPPTQAQLTAAGVSPTTHYIVRAA